MLHWPGEFMGLSSTISVIRFNVLAVVNKELHIRNQFNSYERFAPSEPF
jgi:hypothetical protein